MSKRKYKVGDVVRTLVDTDIYGNQLFPKGTIGTITVIQKFERYPYRVETDESWYYYGADMIEPVDEDGTPKHDMRVKLKGRKPLIIAYGVMCNIAYIKIKTTQKWTVKHTPTENFPYYTISRKNVILNFSKDRFDEYFEEVCE